MTQIGRALRSRAGRLVAVALGTAAVAAIIGLEGVDKVLAALERMAFVLPALLLLEGAWLACTIFALRTLYGAERHQLTLGRLTHAGLMGYVAMAFMPSGRAFAEATRATLLSPYVGAARASFAAFQLQAACLLANSMISSAVLVATWIRCGRSGPLVAISVNLVVTLVMGCAMLISVRRANLGGLLGRLIHRVRDFGTAFDQVAREPAPLPWRATLWELAGRVVQLGQYFLLAAAASGHFSLITGLVAEGTHLVGAAAGEMIPAQIGVTEANFKLYASALQTDSAGAVAMAITAHVVQLGWVLVGLAMVLRFRRTEASPSSTQVPATEAVRWG